VILPFTVLPLAAWFEGKPGLSRIVAGPLRLRHVLAVLILAGLGVNALGLGVNFFNYIQTLRDLDLVHDEWNFIPNLSPIRFHAHIAASWLYGWAGLEAPDFHYRYWCDGTISERVIRMSEYSRSGREPDFFFFRERDTAAERYALSAAGLVLAICAALCGRRLAAVTREERS
jgi:hypothetical protein